jgi:hypothetical protein
MTYLESAATISDCGKYRFDLRRVWDVTTPPVLFVMLNPSTADASEDDPTIRRCVGFAKSWGRGGIVVVNLFALRATDPGELLEAYRRRVDPIGPDNDRHIRAWADRCPIRVAAWGAHPYALGRANYVRTLFSPHGWNLPLCHLGLTKGAHPRHPLYVKGDTKPTLWGLA